MAYPPSPYHIVYPVIVLRWFKRVNSTTRVGLVRTVSNIPGFIHRPKFNPLRWIFTTEPQELRGLTPDYQACIQSLYDSKPFVEHFEGFWAVGPIPLHTSEQWLRNRLYFGRLDQRYGQARYVDHMTTDIPTPLDGPTS